MKRSSAQNWDLRKPAVSSPNGLVSAQNTTAAAIGAQVLSKGGNAVDAAVATALAMGVVEPWMSGIGGGGLMTIDLAADRSTHVIDFNMVASNDLDPAAYPLVAGVGGDMFTWPKVQQDFNVLGYKSICVPGALDGLSLALSRFGSISFDQAITPAIDLAEDGIAVNWFTTLVLATAAEDMAGFPEAVKIFMPDNKIPVAPANGSSPPRVHQPKLAYTLRHLAENGPREFYEGELAASLAEDIHAGGGFLSTDDLANYHAEIVKPISFAYRDVTVHTTPGLTAGPTLRMALEHLAEALSASAEMDGSAFAACAQALKAAYESRFALMGHAGEANSCTTHLNVVDGEGNMVALTNTLLSRFGSKVVLPQSGVLMNNGMMWFDTRPGNPNSIAPGVRPLCNMCPTIVTRDDVPSFALGASGGRQIVSAVCQIISLLIDHGLSLEDAIHHPRLDMSGGSEVALDARLPETWIESISAEMPAKVIESTIYPVLFAIASGVARDNATGVNTGVAEPSHPLAGTMAEGGS